MEKYPIELTSRKQKKTFDYFEKIYTEVVGIPTLANREAIASYTVLFLEIEDLKKELRRNGTTFQSETDRGRMAVKIRPEVGVLEKMEARIFQMKKSLGFYDNDGNKSKSDLGGLEQFM